MVNGKRTVSARDEAGSNKRSRVSRACDQCRSSRERCDGEHKCQTCISQNRTCTYKEAPKKRGIQPNYIRTLELTLAWLFQNLPEVEKQLARNIPQDRHSLTGLLKGKDSENAEALHSAWRGSLIYRQIDQLLSGEQLDTEGQYLSSHANQLFGNSNELPFHQSPSLSVPVASDVLEHHPEDIDRTFGTPQISGVSKEIRSGTGHQDLVKLPENALMLLEHYFAFTHVWLPMTEKHSNLKLLYSYPHEGISRDQLNHAKHAELWSIMALAAAQLSEDTHRQIREVAESLIPNANTNASYEIPHIRAMLILTLVDANEQRMLAAWLHIGMVVSLLLLFRILESLDLTAKWCRHIHLAAFVVESAIASHLQVPVHLRKSYIETVGFVDEDGLDEYETWQDPLDHARQGGQAKAPSRSFSTLNELVRRYMPVRDGDSATHAFTEAGDSIVFSLLKNASLKQGRVQPSVLVAAHRSQNSQTSNGAQGLQLDNSIDSRNTGINHSLAELGTQQPTSNTKSLENYNFMNNLPFQGSTDVVDARTSPAFWTSSPDALQGAEFGTALGDAPTVGADIFEQFDALERQDTNQHSQFYQNLGFAPDVELAEFFGEDYQPSDPLLAYLNPALYGLNQDTGATLSGTR